MEFSGGQYGISINNVLAFRAKQKVSEPFYVFLLGNLYHGMIHIVLINL